MKKIFLTLLLSIPFLFGCGSSEKVSISFGSIGEEEVYHLDETNIDGKLSSENMLIVSYRKDTTCSCWKTFHSEVLIPNIKKNNLRVYSIYTEAISEDLINKGFKKREDAPVFYIVKDGVVFKKFDYESSTGFYSSENAFYNQLQKDCYLPKMFYCSKEYIDQEILKNQQTSLFIMRSSCLDCKKIIPLVLTPYFEKHDGKILTLDIDQYRDDMDIYQEVKDHFHLSETSDPKFGYSLGVVPTLQIWNKGNLIDMCVYLNDEVNDDKTKIISSYYSENRVNSLLFMSSVSEKDRVIEGKEIPAIYKENVDQYFMNLHLPIINGFLSTYFPN